MLSRSFILGIASAVTRASYPVPSQQFHSGFNIYISYQILIWLWRTSRCMVFNCHCCPESGISPWRVLSSLFMDCHKFWTYLESMAPIPRKTHLTKTCWGSPGRPISSAPGRPLVRLSRVTFVVGGLRRSDMIVIAPQLISRRGPTISRHGLHN